MVKNDSYSFAGFRNSLIIHNLFQKFTVWMQNLEEKKLIICMFKDKVKDIV